MISLASCKNCDLHMIRNEGQTPSVRELRDYYLISILFPIAFSTLFEKYLKEEDAPAEAVEADAPEAVSNGAADKNGGGSKGKYDRPGNVKRPKAKKNEVNLEHITDPRIFEMLT